MGRHHRRSPRREVIALVVTSSPVVWLAAVGIFVGVVALMRL